jgi:hypothetical protein
VAREHDEEDVLMCVLVYARVLCVSERSPPPTASLRALIHEYVLTQAQGPRRIVSFLLTIFFLKNTNKSRKDNCPSASSDLSSGLRLTL